MYSPEQYLYRITNSCYLPARHRIVATKLLVRMLNINSSIIKLLRVEATAFLLLSIFAYYQSGFSWILFGVLFLAPDLSMAGYWLGPRWGAAIYNAAHNYALPIAAGALGYYIKSETLLAIALIWAAHISADRSINYGLKLASDFRDTHLGRIGKS